MKIKGLIILSSVIICLSMMISACSPKDGNIGGESQSTDSPTADNNAENSEQPKKLLDYIYDPDFKYSANTVTEAVILENHGQIMVADNFFSVFKSNSENGFIYKVYSHVKGEIVLSFANSEYQANNGEAHIPYTRHGFKVLSTPNDTQILAVATYTSPESSKQQTYNSSTFSGLEVKIPTSKYSLCVDFYDTTGAKIYTYEHDGNLGDLDQKFNERIVIPLQNSLPSTGDTGLFVLADTVFSIAESGTVRSIKSYDVHAIPNITQYAAGQYYAFNLDKGTAQIFNKDLERIQTVTLPNDLIVATDITCHALNNGDILLQYKKVLPDDAANFDVKEITAAKESGNEERANSIVTTKYSLSTYLISSQTGEIKNIEADFIIVSITPLSHLENLYDISKTHLMLNDIENIATLYHINENKEIIKVRHSQDKVALASDGTVSRSLLLKNHWVEVPIPLGDTGLFSVYTINDETEIMNRDGHIMFAYGGKAEDDSVFYHGQKAIYNVTNGRKIYGELNKAKSVIYAGDMYLIEDEGDQDETTLKVLLRDGTEKVLGTLSGNEKNIEKYQYLRNSYYVIHNLTTQKYEYYNTEGTLITASDEELTYVSTTANGIILAGANTGYVHFVQNRLNSLNQNIIPDIFHH